MGYIHVNSPHNGDPVKVLEKDIGRAVKDNDGRLFYVLPRKDGSGYYGAITRADPELEESDAARRDQRIETARSVGHTQGVHDITHMGNPPRSYKGPLALLILAAVAGAVAYLYITGRLPWP